MKTGCLPQLSGTPAAVDVIVTVENVRSAGWPTSERNAFDGDFVARGSGGGALEPLATERCLVGSLAGLHAEPGSGVAPDHPGLPAVLVGTSVARLLCDGQIARIVLGPDSVPLDLGRRSRAFGADQRRALTVRDAGCRFPGCDRPPRYTDAHHLLPWSQGGRTDLTNGRLLCRWHHGRVHAPHDRGGWRIEAMQAECGAQGPLVFGNASGTRLTSQTRAP